MKGALCPSNAKKVIYGREISTEMGEIKDENMKVNGRKNRQV